MNKLLLAALVSLWFLLLWKSSGCISNTARLQFKIEALSKDSWVELSKDLKK